MRRHNDIRRRGDQTAQDDGAQWHGAQHRVQPLIDLLKDAAKAKENVMWDSN
jgi:hypothetical protein